MKSLARITTARPLLTLFVWIAAALGLTIAAQVTTPDFRDVFSMPGADSSAAYDLLDERFPQTAGDTDTLVVRADEGSLTAFREHLAEASGRLASVGSVTTVVGPLEAAGASQLSLDARIGYIAVTYETDAYNLPLTDIEAVAEIAHDLDEVEGLTVGHGGYPASRLSNPEVGPGELIGLAVAAIILVIAFGSARAATVPLISAVIAVTTAVAALGLLTAYRPITSSGPTLAVLLGLGIGIDYALFIVNRHRLGLKAKRPVRDSIVAAMGTSGRAVVFAGITVAIALLGMLVPRLNFLTGLGVTAAVTVLFSVAASTTLVPALLQLYGLRVLNRRERAALDSPAQPVAEHNPGRFARLVERRPLITSLAAIAVMATLAVPALSMRLGSADQGNDPSGTPTRVAFDLMSEGFGEGVNGPLVVVVDLGAPDSLTADADTGMLVVPPSLATFAADLAADAAVANVVGPIPSAAGDTAMFQVVSAFRPQAVETDELVERIRDDYAPAAEAAGLEVHVGGATATTIDFTDRIAASIPLFFALVVGLSMLVLLVAFRSLLLPLAGAAMNLLSAAASFGVVTAVFQWGWGHSLIGVGSGGPVEPFVPLILFALLFGLSMDYQVFLVSRVAELWHGTRDNAYAVRRGLADVSRVIIAAASIMVVVFGSFVTSDARVMKLLGLGLAVAVALDAFVIRVVLMPALMRLLGRANWWMPRWLDNVVPHLDIDGTDTVAHAEQAHERVSAPVT